MDSSTPTQAPSISQQWAALILRTGTPVLPASAMAMAKDRLIDAVATALAAQTLPVPGLVRNFIGAAHGPATAIGSRHGMSALDAAFLNAVQINGCTHDDFTAKSHAGATTIPSALALAEEEQASGAELLRAIVLGYELVARAYLGGPDMLPRFRATGVAGPFGAAAAAAVLMQLSEAQTAHALGLAAMFASGFGQGFHTGAMDVKLNVGWASRSGLSAAQLARCGATAAPQVMEGISGYYRAYANGVDHAQEAVRDLGQRFLIEDTVYKERPVCIFVQTPVELAWRLSRTQGIAQGQIDRVRIRAPLATLTNPGYQNVAPFATALQARISVRFTVAAALLGRPVDTYKYYEAFDDQEVLALADRIELLEPGSDDEVWLEVVCGGTSFEASGREMDHLQPTLDKTVSKYRRLTEGYDARHAQQLLDLLLSVDRLHSLAPLSAALRDISPVQP